MNDLTLFLDRCIEVTGATKSVGGKIVRPIAIHKFIVDYLTANPGIITGVQTLAQVLAVGTITGGNDIEMSNGDVIKAVSGGGTLNLRDGGDNNFGIYTDAGAGSESFITGNTSEISMGYGTTSFISAREERVLMQAETLVSSVYMTPNAIGIDETATLTSVLTPSFALSPVAGGSVTITGVANVGMFLNTGVTPCVYNLGVDNSVIIGGSGITVKTNNTAYCNQLGLNASGSAFEGIIDTATLTADRTYELPNASGIVSLVRYVAVNTPTVHTAATGEVVAVTTGASDLVVNLPSAATASQQITVKKIDAGAGAVNLTPAGADTIDGVAGVYPSLTAQWKSVTLVSNGSTGWLITSAL